MRSFYFNGRRYRLTLRRQLLLYFHDGEAMGAHSPIKETLAKLL